MAADSFHLRTASLGPKRRRNVPAVVLLLAILVLTGFAAGPVASSHAGAIQWSAGAKELEQKRNFQALLDYTRKWIAAEITNPQAWYIRRQIKKFEKHWLNSKA